MEITSKEWQILNAIRYSWTVRELARKAELPYSTAWRILNSIGKKGKVYFMPNYKNMNLLPLAVITKKDVRITEVSSYTVSIREIYGLKTKRKLIYALIPSPYVNKFIDTLGLDDIIVVRGYEYIRWTANSGFFVYVPNVGVLMPVYGNIEETLPKYAYPVEKYEGLKAPDKIDLAIIQGKMRDAFMTPSNAIKHAIRVDPSFPRISKQLISYHALKHVKARYWRGNTINFFYPMDKIPIRIWYFKGRDAPIISRILVSIPSFFTATIDVEDALVIGQPPCYMLEDLYKWIFTLFEDVEMPLGDLVMSSKNIRRFRPRLWMFVDKGKWMWIDELVYAIGRL
ncbi:MAG: hypothetical protein DRJ38_06750 [Thermoprotei archaeon]|nr:MAG: hypothetical protein DRJ38_06750 [Thermoprotei archaeon]